MKKIMFVCLGNSCRSQMAEGFARVLGEGKVETFSAGTQAGLYVHPKGIAVMREKGIDISGQHSKQFDLEVAKEMDMVVTVCDETQECPVLPKEIQHRHLPIEDPFNVPGDEEAHLNAFRKARDEIETMVQNILKEF